MYLAGGYKLLARDQVLDWCKPRGHKPAEGRFTVNRLFKNENHPIRILACDYQRDPIFFLVTHQKEDPTATELQYKYFDEN